MTAVNQPAGSVTLVFTDIEGSTKLLSEFGTEPYREALAEHRRIVREACARYSGYEVDYEGDAFFYAFASAGDAVSAVSEAMDGLKEGPISIRVGIHSGEPELDPPKYVGMDVHRAARIMSSAHGGQVVLSPSTVSLLEPGAFTLRELGEHRLKDLAEPVAIYQLGYDSPPRNSAEAQFRFPRARRRIFNPLHAAGPARHADICSVSWTRSGGIGRSSSISKRARYGLNRKIRSRLRPVTS